MQRSTRNLLTPGACAAHWYSWPLPWPKLHLPSLFSSAASWVGGREGGSGWKLGWWWDDGAIGSPIQWLVMQVSRWPLRCYTGPGLGVPKAAVSHRLPQPPSNAVTLYTVQSVSTSSVLLLLAVQVTDYSVWTVPWWLLFNVFEKVLFLLILMSSFLFIDVNVYRI